MFQQSTKSAIAQLDQQAKSLLQQVIITRTWVAAHGGLFVVKQPGVESNPFLPDTDVEDLKGNIYSFRNPAMVTRELSKYADRAGLYRFRLTSLSLKNPSNAPLPFEADALRYFQEKGYDKTRSGLASEGIENGIRVYRRIVPLLVEKSCIECHAYQGYSVGDIRGGLSVFIPMGTVTKAIQRNRNILIVSWIGIICLVSGVIYFLLRNMVLKPVEHLHQVAQKLIDGKYNVRAKVSTGDEFEALAHALNDMTDRLKKGYEGTIKSLVAAVEARDSYTKGHTSRVARYSIATAKEMGLSDEMLAEIELGAILHDIGKIGVADEILRKTTPLANEEVRQMEAHVLKGADIINDADFLLHALPAILYHHERPDGKGYPHGLKGDNLPLVAKIIAVADTFDAITTDRPYRKALTDEEAVLELEKYSGKQFDRNIVQAFKVAFAKMFNCNIK